MYCGRCGTANKEGARFCSSCGNQLKMEPVPQIRTEEKSETMDVQTNVKKESQKAASQTSEKEGNSGNVNNITISMGESKTHYASHGEGEGLAIASMILGIVSLVVSCCFYYISLPCAIISVVLAAVSLKGKRGGRGMAIAGLVCAIISLVPAMIMISTGAAVISLFS